MHSECKSKQTYFNKELWEVACFHLILSYAIQIDGRFRGKGCGEEREEQPYGVQFPKAF